MNQEIVQPDVHDDCGHAHHEHQDCPDRRENCGSYICCQPGMWVEFN